MSLNKFIFFYIFYKKLIFSYFSSLFINLIASLSPIIPGIFSVPDSNLSGKKSG